MRPRAILAALALAFLGGLAVAGPASAWHEDYPASSSAVVQAVQAGNLWGEAPTASASSSPNTDTLGGVTLSATAVTVLVGLVLPIANGLLVKYRAPGVVKGLVALATSAITGLIVAGQTVDGGAFLSRSAITLGGIAFVIQTASYLGIYAPADLNGRLLPDRGLGREVPGKPGPKPLGSSWS